MFQCPSWYEAHFISLKLSIVLVPSMTSSSLVFAHNVEFTDFCPIYEAFQYCFGAHCNTKLTYFSKTECYSHQHCSDAFCDMQFTGFCLWCGAHWFLSHDNRNHQCCPDISPDVKLTLFFQVQACSHCTLLSSGI